MCHLSLSPFEFVYVFHSLFISVCVLSLCPFLFNVVVGLGAVSLFFVLVFVLSSIFLVVGVAVFFVCVVWV